jgi:hypothetical protein
MRERCKDLRKGLWLFLYGHKSCTCNKVRVRQTELQHENPLIRSSRSGGRCAVQVTVVPREDAIQSVQQMLLLVETVRLSRVDDQFGLDAISLQPAVQLLALSASPCSTSVGVLAFLR